MSDDHDLIIRLDEKVETAKKDIEDLKEESATKEALGKVETSLGQLKIGLSAIGVAVGGAVVNFVLGLIDNGSQ